MRAPSAFRYPALINGSALLTAQPCGLRGKVASHAPVDPALELVGQIKDFDCHCGSPLHVRGSRSMASEPRDASSNGVASDIGHLGNRFQYLSVNSS
jgi:hypothetical protein